LDARIASLQSDLHEFHRARERIDVDLDRVAEELRHHQSKLAQFEAANAAMLKSLREKGDSPDAILSEANRLEGEANTFDEESRALYKERDALKVIIREHQEELFGRYRTLESAFVPEFRRLAERFLGMDIQVDAELRDLTFGLVVQLKSQARRDLHALSESQRFFLDIALRMSLAAFAAATASVCTLIIDTPEGSLDIAYEARAGEMFSKFVSDGRNILMTANVNSSQLLIKLARSCGRGKMTLVRMTEWAELSEVQLEEHDLFEKAFKEIEDAFEMGNVADAARGG
jgi:DNA repair exonuclease SbcCD ATPase subunit